MNKIKKPKPRRRCPRLWAVYQKLKFWYRAMLETDLMNDKNHRKEFQDCLDEIKDYSKE